MLQEIRQSWSTALIVAVVSCLLGAASGFAYLQFRFVGVTGTPSDAVLRYLTAISQNDSVRALNEIARPPSDVSFLTDEVLRASHLDNPMSETEIPATRSLRVPVRFSLGTQKVETTISVTVVGGVFMIDDGLVTANLAQARALQAPLTVGDRAVMQDEIKLFPGVYPLKSGDPRLALTPKASIQAVHVDETAFLPEQSLVLSDTGDTAIRASVAAAINKCSKQESAVPTGCPFSVTDDPKYATGKIKWESLTEPATKTVVGTGSATVTVSGTMRFTWVPPAGIPESTEVPLSANGTVDILSSDWQVTWK